MIIFIMELRPEPVLDTAWLNRNRNMNNVTAPSTPVIDSAFTRQARVADTANTQIAEFANAIRR